jgi:hypothetical protein
MSAILRCQQRIAFMNQLNVLSNRVEYYGADDMFQSDDNDGGVPASIQNGVGYVAPSSGEVGASFKGTALSHVVPESTWVLETDFLGNVGVTHVQAVAYDDPSLSGTFWVADLNENAAFLSDTSAHALDNGSGLPTLNRLAFTFSPNKLSLSVNGSSTITLANPRVIKPIIFGTFYITNSSIIKSVTIYPPKDDADLPALSAL